MITLYQMDVMKALKQIPDESVDMQITSPPYWGLRDYGVEGQIGLEPDFNDYIKRMCDIFDEVKRVLKKDGTCWVNLGDTYNSTPAGITEKAYDNWAKESDKDGLYKRLIKRHSQGDMKDCTPKKVSKLLPIKCLTMIPERFALEMVDRGWILRNKIIWHKPNHMPTSVKDRFANSWEYLFMFSKSKKYYFDLDAVREPHKTGAPQADNDLKRMMSGRQEFEGIRSDCKYCDGTGIDPETMNKCQDCKGKGRLHSVQKSFVAGNPKGRNPDDIIVSKKEQEYFEQHPIKGGGNKNQPDLMRELRHPKGKNPDDIISASPQSLKQKGWANNPGHQFTHERKYEPGSNEDYWNITTQPYKEAHFAVFPEKLVERPIKTTPKWICKKCGKPRERITENEFVKTADAQPSKIGDANRNPEKRTDLPANRGYTLHHTKGWTSCKCNAGFRLAVILDIFAGSGTTLAVARRLKRDSIGIEIKKEYCDLIYKRLFGTNQQTLVPSFKLIGGINGTNNKS